MSALDGKITIERELRPCIVRIPDKKKQFKEMKAIMKKYRELKRKYRW